MRPRTSATVLFLTLSACSSTSEPPGPQSDALPPGDASEAFTVVAAVWNAVPFERTSTFGPVTLPAFPVSTKYAS